MPGRSFEAASPARVVRQKRNSPFASLMRVRSSTFTPQESAKAVAARVGLPAASKAAVHRRTPALDALLRLPVEQLGDQDGEAARREVRLDRAVGEARGGKTRDDAVPERLAERDEAPGRHLLRADFHEEVVAVHLRGLVMRTVACEPVSEGTVP